MILLLGLLLLLATFATKLAAKLSVPGLVVFLSLGMLFGSDGLGLIHFDDTELAKEIATICLLFILFEGGFNTKRDALKEVLVPASLLATIGVIITALVLGLLIHLVLGLALPYAMLIGAITSSTDAAAVFAILKNKLLKGRLSTTLESESAANDPMAIILTMATIQYIQGQIDSPLLMVLNLLWQLAIGLIIGLVVAKGAVMLFNKLNLEGQSFYYVLALGIGLLSFGLSELINGNGFLAVFVTGIVLGNTRFIFKRGVALFLEGVSTFTHVFLFLILGLLVFPSEAVLVWQEGLVVALLLIFVARPIALYLTVAFNQYQFKEKLFLSWAGVKGSVPIVLATYPLAAGLELGSYIFNIVFFVVLISTILQGSTIDWFAKRMNLYIGSKQSPPHSLELISLEKSQVELMEYEVRDTSPCAGKRIVELTLPKHTLVVGIVRDNDIIAPGGGTQIKAGDILFILVRYSNKETVLQCLNKEASMASSLRIVSNKEDLPGKALYEKGDRTTMPKNKLCFQQPELVCVIAKYGLAHKVIHFAKQNGIRYGTALLGKFKVKHRVLDFLELSEMRAEVVFLVCENPAKYPVFDQLKNILRNKELFAAFTIPLPALLGNSQKNFLFFEKGSDDMHNAIIAIVDKGKGELAIEAANKAGAQGGTIINARGLGLGKTKKVFSMEIVAAQELIIILTKTELIEKIVDAIRNELKIKDLEEVIFVQNVKDVYGTYG